MTTKAYGAHAADKPVEALAIERRAPGPTDVQVEIAYCGVCHSDLHTVRSEWPGTLYPCVPGHEIVGHVSAVGSDVSGFKVGDTVGIGCLVYSCQQCSACADGLEQFCEKGMGGTYNAPIADAPGHTLGSFVHLAGNRTLVVGDRAVVGTADDASSIYRDLEEHDRVAFFFLGEGEDSERHPFFGGRRRGLRWQHDPVRGVPGGDVLEPALGLSGDVGGIGQGRLLLLEIADL
jgi:hypothetical protein